MKRSVIIMAILIGSNLGSYQRKVLKNGLTLLVYQKKKLPIVSCVYAFKTGSVYDPEGKEGLASFTLSMLEKGTGTKTAEEVQEEFATLGTKFSYNASRIFSSISITTLEENLDKSFNLMYDIIYNPLFPEQEFKREKERLINEIISNKSDPDYVSEVIFTKYLYNKHPLGHLAAGNENTVKNINLEDIKQFYRNYFKPSNAICVIVGSLPEDKLVEIGEKYFGKGKKELVNLPEIPAPEKPRGINVKIFNMKVNQSYIEMGHFGPKRGSEDFNSARVMNYILGGGGFASRLFEEIRNKRGYAYSVYSFFRINDPFPSAYIFGLQTKIENTNDAIKVLFDEINKIKKNIKDEEIEDTKGYFQGYLPRITETYSQIASNLLTQELYGLEPFFWEKDVQEIQRLEKGQLIESAKEYLDPENILIVIVTDTSKYKWNVKGLKNVNIDVIERF